MGVRRGGRAERGPGALTSLPVRTARFQGAVVAARLNCDLFSSCQELAGGFHEAFGNRSFRMEVNVGSVRVAHLPCWQQWVLKLIRVEEVGFCFFASSIPVRTRLFSSVASILKRQTQASSP